MDDRSGASNQSVADLLTMWIAGDGRACDRLFDVLYEQLRPIASRQLRGRPRGGTLDTTALIHEAYLKLVEGGTTPVASRGHFLALASRVMRQIILDHVRMKRARKRGGDLLRASLGGESGRGGTSVEDVLAIDQALERLEVLDPRLVRLVEARFFGGLSIEETAEALGLSIATVKRDWIRARAFLYQQVRRDAQG